MSNRRYTGTVDGERAANWHGYTYRTAVIEPVTMWSLDPDRLYYDSEYPRYVTPPCDAAGKIAEHVDWAVEIAEDPGKREVIVTVIVLPNRYTACDTEAVICQFFADPLVVDDTVIIDQALNLAFR